MEEIFQTKLSSNEIFIIAAALGHNNVPGVADDRSLIFSQDIKKRVNKAFAKLETKKILQYEIDGTLRIKSEIKKIADCICTADAFGIFASNFQGKKKTVHIYKKDGFIVTSEKSSEKYRLRLFKEFSIENLIPKKFLNSEKYEICERILFEEAEIIKNNINSFDIENAETMLKKRLNEKKHMSLILKNLGTDCSFLSIQMYKNNSFLYNPVFNILLTYSNDCTIKVYSDKYNVLCFDSFDINSLISQLQPIFYSQQQNEVLF